MEPLVTQDKNKSRTNFYPILKIVSVKTADEINSIPNQNHNLHNQLNLVNNSSKTITNVTKNAGVPENKQTPQVDATNIIHDADTASNEINFSNLTQRIYKKIMPKLDRLQNVELNKLNIQKTDTNIKLTPVDVKTYKSKKRTALSSSNDQDNTFKIINENKKSPITYTNKKRKRPERLYCCICKYICFTEKDLENHYKYHQFKKRSANANDNTNKTSLSNALTVQCYGRKEVSAKKVGKILYKCRFCTYISYNKLDMKQHIKGHNSKTAENSQEALIDDLSNSLTSQDETGTSVQDIPNVVIENKGETQPSLDKQMSTNNAISKTRKKRNRSQKKVINMDRYKCNNCKFFCFNSKELIQHYNGHKNGTQIDIVSDNDKNDEFIDPVNETLTTEDDSSVQKIVTTNKNNGNFEVVNDSVNVETPANKISILQVPIETTSDTPVHRFKCIICDYVCFKIEDIKKHSLIHKKLLAEYFRFSLKSNSSIYSFYTSVMKDVFPPTAPRTLPSDMKTYSNKKASTSEDTGVYPKTEIECNVCEMTFSNELDFEVHKSNCSTEVDPKTAIECTVCKMTFSNELDFKIHKSDCDQNGGNHNAESDRRKVIKINYTTTIPYLPTKPCSCFIAESLKKLCTKCVTNFVCRNCQIPFQSYKDLQDHFHQSHQRLSIFCSKCGYGARTSEDCIIHIEKQHYKFKCTSCQMYFPTEVKWSEHGCRPTDLLNTNINKSDVESTHMKDQFCSYVIPDLPIEKCTCSTPDVKLCIVCSGHRYKCLECTYSSDKYYLLRQHYKDYHSELNSFCQVCGKGFVFKNSCMQHIETKHKILISCMVCHKIVKSEKQLQIHLMEHYQVSTNTASTKDVISCENMNLAVFNFKHVPKILKGTCVCADVVSDKRCNKCNAPFFHCNNCEKSYFESYEKLALHYAKTHKDLPYICPFCGLSFADIENVKNHLTKAHSIVNFFCEICKVTFHHKEDLLKHKDIHVNREIYGIDSSCSLCDKRFPTQARLIQHLHKDHQLAYSYKCSFCNNTFLTKKERNKCERGHKIRCEQCKEIFTKQSSLEDHMKLTHNFRKPCICFTCGKSYNNLKEMYQNCLNHLLI